MQERRSYQRMPLAISLEIYTEVSKSITRKGFITNLSEEGVAFETPKNLYVGEKVFLHFNLPDKSEIDVNGEVVYSREGILTKAYGAKFDNVKLDIEEKLKNFLNEKILR